MIQEETTDKKKPGIKHPLFTSSRTNGKSHRANRERKHRQYLRNRDERSAFYSEFQGEKGWKGGTKDCDNWHAKLKALSAGTA